MAQAQGGNADWILHPDNFPKAKYSYSVKAKESGAIRQEGNEYVMKDGDVVVFKFNV